MKKLMILSIIMLSLFACKKQDIAPITYDCDETYFEAYYNWELDGHYYVNEQVTLTLFCKCKEINVVTVCWSDDNCYDLSEYEINNYLPDTMNITNKYNEAGEYNISVEFKIDNRLVTKFGSTILIE